MAQSQPAGTHLNFETFKTPPAQYRGRVMADLDLSTTTEKSLLTSVQDFAQQDRYGGFFLVVSGGSTRGLNPAYVRQANPHLHFSENGIEYLSEDFFKLYRSAVEEGRKRGLSFVLYDDYAYPTGTIGGQLYSKYPQYMAKRLDMVEADQSGPGTAHLTIPKGTYIGAVMMNLDTHERVDVSDHTLGANRLECAVPSGRWKVMAFYLNHDAVLKIRNPGLVDYLAEDAMKAFLSLTYDQFYSHLKPFFGSVIKMSFFDEPTLHWLDGRTWTPSFNKMFEQTYGYSPMKDYPALWYDIGPDTASARNALFGFRAHLFSDNFVGRIHRWCAAHGILSSGHLDQEEAPNPVPINGDLMKAFEQQDIPGADDIFYLGRSNRGYKIVTSAAFNYDKPVAMAETYAAYTKLDEKSVFQTAMDQFAMGINMQLPWEGIDKVVKNVPELNEYVGRLSYLLQHGRHVSDIAVLYPIAALQTAYTFSTTSIPDAAKPDTDHSVNELAREMGPGWEYAYHGGVPPPEIDYMDLGEELYRGLRLDYTYIHPEVLVSRTLADQGRLVLNNRENREEYRVLIVPGGDTISAAAAHKIEEFYDKGGAVVATSKLPGFSAEHGLDGLVCKVFGHIFGVSPEVIQAGRLPISQSGYYAHSNAAGGRAVFIPKPGVPVLETVLKQVLPVRDVRFAEPARPLLEGRSYDGALTYIHKVKNGQDIYFFANSSRRFIDTTVMVRGKKNLIIWDPQAGTRHPAQQVFGQGRAEVTRLRLILPPVTSLFYIQE